MLPRPDLWNHVGDYCPLAPGCSTPSGEGHGLSGGLHRHAQAVGDGLVGPVALKLISPSSPSEATAKPNISTSQRKPTASCGPCWSNPSSTAKKRHLNQTLHRGYRSLQFSTLSFHRRTSRCCLGEVSAYRFSWTCGSTRFSFNANRATRSPSRRALSSSPSPTPGSSGPVIAAAPTSAQTLPVLSF
jgi:hypothetical protein